MEESNTNNFYDTQKPIRKKRKWWLWLILIFIILIGGIFSFLLFSQETKGNYGQRAFNEHNASICLEMNTDKGEYPMDCFRYIAHQTSDITFCTSLQEGWDYQCSSAFLTVRWCKYNEVLCGNFKNQKDRNDCYRITAIAKNDKTLCNQMILNQNEDTSGSATYDDGTTISWKDSIEECKFIVDDQNSQQNPCLFVDRIA